MNKSKSYRLNSAMIYRWKFYLILFFTMLISCQPESSSQQIALVFQAINPINSRHPLQKIRYVDDFMIPHEHIILQGQSFKLINTARDWVDVHFLEEDIICRDYLFKAGDSVLFSVDTKWPEVKIINREINEHEQNFENEMYSHFYGDKHSPTEDFYYYWSLINSRHFKALDIDMSEELEGLKKRALHGLEKERSYIDSLRSSGILNNEIASYYFIKNEFDYDKISLSVSGSMQFVNHELMIALFDTKTKSDSTIKMQYFTFYDQFLTHYYDLFLLPQMQAKIMDTSPINNLKYIPVTFKRVLVNKHVDYHLKSLSPEEGMLLVENLESEMAYHKKWKT